MTLFYPPTQTEAEDVLSSSLSSSYEQDFVLNINRMFKYRPGDECIPTYENCQKPEKDNEVDEHLTIFEIDDVTGEEILKGNDKNNSNNNNNNNNHNSSSNSNNNSNININNHSSNSSNSNSTNSDNNISTYLHANASDTKCNKNVRFADDSDRSLVEIRTYLPTPPYSLLFSPEFFLHNFLRFRSTTDIQTSGQKKHEDHIKQPTDLKLCFPQQDCNSHEVEERCVLLHKCSTRQRMISGIILVKNISYEKRVFVRYTTDCWTSHNDLDAVFITNIEQGSFDRFSFTLCLPSFTCDLEFAICYETPLQQYWDNNGGANYKVEQHGY